MTRQEGYTIIELLMASAVMLAVLAVVTTLLHDGLIGVPALEEAGDLHQRTRVAAEAIATELRSAGAGGEFGRLTDAFASVLPRTMGDGPTVAVPDVLTILYVPPNGATSRLLTALDPGGPTAFIEAVTGCPALVIACGFNANTRAVLFDGAGGSDVVSVDAIGPGMLTISDVWGGRSGSYAPGSYVAEVITVTFSLDAVTRQLRRLVGAATFTLADNVTALRFQYYDGALLPVPLTALTDGPFRGSGLTMIDADLRRVRTVRVTLRLETGVDELRGRDPQLFARPGTADARRLLPDVETTFDVTVRNGGLP
jgi:type II secretory pathway pseudopilin PulG